MSRTKLIVITAGALAALAGGGAAIAGAVGGGDDDATDRAITGSALQRASDAALAAVPGKVTETEAGDEEGAYEVEVTKADGSQVDVHLDEEFNVLGAQPDRERDGDDED